MTTPGRNRRTMLARLLPLLLAFSFAAAQLPLQPSRHLRWAETEATWASLDISPDGRTITFELLGDLYQIPSAGGEARCIACGLPFDSQPAYSPDGAHLGFVSDRSGNENLWVSAADGSAPRQISFADDNCVWISPAWAADGKSIFLSRFKPDLNAFELFRFPLDGGPAEQLTHSKPAPDTPKEFRTHALGAAASPDGRYVFYAAKTGYGFDDDVSFPLWHIDRRDLRTGDTETVVTAEGSAFRPGVSPDGRLLVYATRYRGETGLRVRDLRTDTDRWLAYPVQRDDQEASASRDLLPRYAFTPDSRALVLNYGGKLRRVELATGTATEIPFHADVDLPAGPFLRQDIREETGPVRARLLQTPSESPDGTRLLFSALAHVYTAPLGPGPHAPTRLTHGDQPEFDPAWSPDGRRVLYVTWTRSGGGDIWASNADGSGTPQKLTDHPDFYRNPVFSLDGAHVLALRSSQYDHNQRFMEFGNIPSELVELPAAGGEAHVLASGVLSDVPQFTTEEDAVFVHFADGLYRVPLDGRPKRRVLAVEGPTWYFVDGLAPADALRISPDGQYALAQITQQLYLIRIPPCPQPAGHPCPELHVELAKPNPLGTRITSAGADFFGWADDGRTITWALGSSFYRQPLASVLRRSGQVGAPPEPDETRAGVETVPLRVDVPRDLPHGTLLLHGATALTMQGDTAIDNADVLVVGDRIAQVGPAGSFPVPPGVTVRDITGKFLLPGFTDVHLHFADVRRGELDLSSWGFRAALAYGITSALDPSPLSIDMLAYEDLLDAGVMIGPRVHSTGPAVFSFNDFHSYAQTLNVLRRYPELYRTRNLKEYRTGNRRQREWVLQATDALHIQATTEGALDMKLDMTQIQDGFPGNEHAFSAVPLHHDIVELFARSGVSYTPTLQISNGGLAAQEFFYTGQPIADDPKLRHFVPAFLIDRKTERLHWALPREYSFAQVAEGAARIQRAGGLVAVGSHGEMLGLSYHLELQALAAGGMTPMEVLHAATVGSATTIGRAAEIGTLEPGKFADLVILTRDPRVDIRNTEALEAVMKNGRLYAAGTLDQLYPSPHTEPPPWFLADDPLPAATSSH